MSQRFIERAINTLDALKVRYAIEMPDGTIVGDLKIEPAAPARKRAPKGTYSQFYDPVIKDMMVGEVGTIDVPVGVDIAMLARSITGTAGSRWGTGSCATHLDSKNRTIEILRMK